MPEVVVSSVLPAPADRVWAAIRVFDAVADWLPFVASSPIEDGGDPALVRLRARGHPDEDRGQPLSKVPGIHTLTVPSP